MAKGRQNDGFWGNPFGGFFDFNGDGLEDLEELWIAEQIFEDIEREESARRRSSEWTPDWRVDVEDGSAYGLFPEDYSTQEAYEDAKRG